MSDNIFPLLLEIKQDIGSLRSQVANLHEADGRSYSKVDAVEKRIVHLEKHRARTAGIAAGIAAVLGVIGGKISAFLTGVS